MPDDDLWPERLLRPAEKRERQIRQARKMRQAKYDNSSPVRPEPERPEPERPERWVKAQRIRGKGSREWVTFSEAQWDAMSHAERCCYQFQRTAEPGNKFQLTAKSSGRKGTLVISALSGIKRY